MSAPPPLDPGLLRSIAEEASDGFFVTDGSLRIEWVNRRGCEMLGRPRAALVGRRLSDFMPADARRDAELHAGDVVPGRTTIAHLVLERPDGTAHVLEVSVSAIADGRVLGIARDISELVAQRERVQRSEASFRALIESSPDGIVVHRGGRIVYANEAAARLLGFDAPWEVEGIAALEILHPDDRPKALTRMRDLEAGLPTVPFTDERLIRRDGSIIRCSIGGVRVMFEGQPSTVVIVRDVTEQRRLQAQLAQAERMASLGALSAGVAHEINNPLAYVVLHLEAITALAGTALAGTALAGTALAGTALAGTALAGTAPAASGAAGLDGREVLADIAKHAASAAEGVDRVRTIVRDLRVISRADETTPGRPTDVITALETALRTASHELERRARVERTLQPVPPVIAAEGRLVQVFLNLLVNAAHAIPEGDREHHTVRVRCWAEDDTVRVEVTDDGVGIAPERMQHLFEPFFTTKESTEGAGLGLAICHGIVSSIGERIDVESAPRAGSTFTVVMPGAVGAAASAGSSRPPSAALARRRVLLVDDEPAIRRALSTALGDRHDVVVAEGGEEAIAILGADDRFDAIVCDVLMPRVGGAELHAWALAHRPALEPRMLFMSGGRVGPAAQALADRVGARWIDKPFPLARLEQRIDEIARAAERARAR